MASRGRIILVSLIAGASVVLSVVCLGLLTGDGAQVPVSYHRLGLVLVPARVGGVEGRYLLDTGCDTTAVTPRVASALESTGRSVEVSTSLSTNDPVHATAALSGGIQFASGSLDYPTHVDVMDHSRLSMLLGDDVDGILGWDVLRNYVIGIDSRGQRLFASRNIGATAMLERLGAGQADTRLVLETLDESPFLMVTYESQSLRLMLDTGATVTTLFSETWHRLNVEPPIEPAPNGVSWGVTGESPVRAGRLKELSLGPLRLADVSVLVSSVEGAVAQKGVSRVSFDGVLGMNVLSKYFVVIDGPEGVLYLVE